MHPLYNIDYYNSEFYQSIKKRMGHSRAYAIWNYVMNNNCKELEHVQNTNNCVDYVCNVIKEIQGYKHEN
jgi:hypothetical protein